MGLFKSVGKIFKKVGKTVAKVAPYALAAAAVVFTGGAALGVGAMAGGWGAAAASLASFAGPTLAPIIGGALTQAGYGAAVGGVLGGKRGLKSGAAIGAITGATMGAMGMNTDPLKGVWEKKAAADAAQTYGSGKGLIRAENLAPAQVAQAPGETTSLSAAGAGGGSGAGDQVAKTGWDKFLESSAAGGVASGVGQGLLSLAQSSDDGLQRDREERAAVEKNYGTLGKGLLSESQMDNTVRPLPHERFGGGLLPPGTPAAAAAGGNNGLLRAPQAKALPRFDPGNTGRVEVGPDGRLQWVAA